MASNESQTLSTQHDILDPKLVISYLHRLNRIDSTVAGATRKLIDHTVVMHFKEFLDLLKIAIVKFKVHNGETPFTTVLTTLNKSDSWVIDLIKEFDEGFIGTVKLIDNLDESDMNVVIFDDGSFCGIRLINTIQYMQHIFQIQDLPERIPTVITAVTSETDISNLTFMVELNLFYGKAMRIQVSDILESYELDAIEHFYDLGDNVLEDQYPVFFAHKIPGAFSSIPFVHAGLILEKGIITEEYPFIDGCPVGQFVQCPPVPCRKVGQIQYQNMTFISLQ